MKWNSNLYDQQHPFVSTFGEDVLSWLQPKSGENILDVGCGTGDLAKKIADEGANVVGIDSSEDMIQTAHSKYPMIVFQVIDGEHIPFVDKFDAVFSNATFHWVKNQKALLSGIYRSLRTEGRLIAEFGGKGNIEAIQTALSTVAKKCGLEKKVVLDFWYFPSIGEYATLLETVGFKVDQALYFDRPTPLEGEEGMRWWIRQFATLALAELSATEQDLVIDAAVEALREERYFDGQWIADYKRIRIKATKW